MESPGNVAISNIKDLPAQAFPWGAIKWLCHKGLAPQAQQTLGLVFILPGQQNPLHYHPNCEEILFVLSGEGDHSFNGDWVHLSPGMTICIPAGVRHNLVNKGWEPLTCVISFSSPERQTVFLE